MKLQEHPWLRIVLMILFFALGIALVVMGWQMNGKLYGLFIMLAGVGSLLATLAIYNKPFTR